MNLDAARRSSPTRGWGKKTETSRTRSHFSGEKISPFRREIFFGRRQGPRVYATMASSEGRE